MMSRLETGPQYPAKEGSKISGDPAKEVDGQGLFSGPITGPSNATVTEQAVVLGIATAPTQETLNESEIGPQYPANEGSKMPGEPTDEVDGQGLVSGPTTRPSNATLTEQDFVLAIATALTQTINELQTNSQYIANEDSGQGVLSGPTTHSSAAVPEHAVVLDNATAVGGHATSQSNATVTEQSVVADSVTASTLKMNESEVTDISKILTNLVEIFNATTEQVTSPIKLTEFEFRTQPFNDDPSIISGNLADEQNLPGDQATNSSIAAVEERTNLIDDQDTLISSMITLETSDSCSTKQISVSANKPEIWVIPEKLLKYPTNEDESSTIPPNSTTSKDSTVFQSDYDLWLQKMIDANYLKPGDIPLTLNDDNELDINERKKQTIAALARKKGESERIQPRKEQAIPTVGSTVSSVPPGFVPNIASRYRNMNEQPISHKRKRKIRRRELAALAKDNGLQSNSLITMARQNGSSLPNLTSTSTHTRNTVSLPSTSKNYQRVPPADSRDNPKRNVPNSSDSINAWACVKRTKPNEVVVKQNLNISSTSATNTTQNVVSLPSTSTNNHSVPPAYARDNIKRTVSNISNSINPQAGVKDKESLIVPINSTSRSGMAQKDQQRTSQNDKSVPPANARDNLKSNNSDDPSASITKRPTRPVSKESLEMALIDAANPEGKIPVEHCLKVEDAIFALLDAHMDIEGAPKIKFNISSWINQTYRISCFDQIARDFLVKSVNGMTPPYSNARLKAVQKDNIPRFVNGTVTIPGPISRIDKILKRIKNQNEWLYTDQWIVEKTEEKDGATIMAVKLDIASARRIRRLKNQVHYGYGQIKFTLDWSTDTGPIHCVIEID